MMYVICFYWQGDRWQQTSYVEQDDTYVNQHQWFINKVGKVTDDLPSKYVNNLYRGVKRFANCDFKFVCFTNEQLALHKDIEVRPFKQVTRRGVLPRLYMFSQDAGLFGHQVLCLDLDVVVVGKLDALMNYDGLFCARSKFRKGLEWKLDGDILSFKAGKETEEIFWNSFTRDISAAEQLTGGRERYWFRHVAEKIADRWDRVAPGRVISYKRHVRVREPYFEPETSIISCHGTPRPHQIKARWIKKYWK